MKMLNAALIIALTLASGMALAERGSGKVVRLFLLNQLRRNNIVRKNTFHRPI